MGKVLVRPVTGTSSTPIAGGFTFGTFCTSKLCIKPKKWNEFCKNVHTVLNKQFQDIETLLYIEGKPLDATKLKTLPPNATNIK